VTPAERSFDNPAFWHEFLKTLARFSACDANWLINDIAQRLGVSPRFLRLKLFTHGYPLAPVDAFNFDRRPSWETLH
jgi:hypothetical protein